LVLLQLISSCLAPEVAKAQGYDKSVDLYSIGVILYILLCGYPPFEPESGIVDLEFPPKEWSDISKVVIDLISKLLSADSSRRPTALQMLSHPWVKGESASHRKLVGTIGTIKKFQQAAKTGQTMRSKDPVTKVTVFNIFEAPPDGHRVGTEKSLSLDKKPPVSVAPRVVKSDSKEDKKNQERLKKEEKKQNKKNKKNNHGKDDKNKKPEAAPVVSFAVSNSDTGKEPANNLSKKDQEIAALQKQLAEEKAKVKQLEARVAELEGGRKNDKKSSNSKKKSDKKSKK